MISTGIASATVSVLPPPLRGTVGEGGMPQAPVGKFYRSRAKQLRRTMTRAETLLWRHLKAHRLDGMQFRRQTPIGSYITDFCCHAARVIVEVDGESHDLRSQLQHDTRRDAWLASRGYRVLRFTNDDVLKNLEGVIMMIGQASKNITTPPSLSLPRKGGGNDVADAGAK
jgi:very-short-patch-repair endonuclease